MPSILGQLDFDLLLVLWIWCFKHEHGEMVSALFSAQFHLREP